MRRYKVELKYSVFNSSNTKSKYFSGTFLHLKMNWIWNEFGYSLFISWRRSQVENCDHKRSKVEYPNRWVHKWFLLTVSDWKVLKDTHGYVRVASGDFVIAVLQYFILRGRMIQETVNELLKHDQGEEKSSSVKNVNKNIGGVWYMFQGSKENTFSELLRWPRNVKKWEFGSTPSFLTSQSIQRHLNLSSLFHDSFEELLCHFRQSINNQILQMRQTHRKMVSNVQILSF